MTKYSEFYADIERKDFRIYTWRCKMRIASYNINQSATSKLRQSESVKTSVEVRQVNIENDQLDISDEGMLLNEIEDDDDAFLMLSDEDKNKIELLESFMTWLTGKKVKFERFYTDDKKGLKENKIKHHKVKNAMASKTGKPNTIELPEGFGARIHTVHERYEKEAMDFSSKGTIRTEDGREIDFSYHLNMSRESYHKSETEIQIGEVFQDPLVIDYGGKGVDFGDKKIKIDIDLDGNLDEIAMLSQNNGFLALDHNANGKVDDGSELFGPRTNNGFDELRAYDVDENGWIDENDKIFKSLKLWTVDGDGNETLIGIKEAGVGAIYLGNVASKFTIVNGEDQLAKVKNSSIYLTEDGKVNGIHEVDLKL